MAADDDRRPRGRRPRLLLAVLGIQVLLGVALILAALFAWPSRAALVPAGSPDAPAPAIGSDPGVPAARVDRFDGWRAYQDVLMQLGYGPRPAGTLALRALSRRLVAALPSGHLESLPGQPGLRNVVGQIPGALPAIVIGAHYDTNDIPGTGPDGANGYLGANDGAAGTAVVLELARDLRHAHRAPGAPALRFVLFDGEEPPAGTPESDFYAAGDRGSKAYVAAHRNEVREMILVDFVGGRGVRLPRELGSDPALWARIRAAARKIGEGPVFPGATYPQILDDHTPFARAGIAAVDLIDYSYPCGDRACDTASMIFPASLDAVGETLDELLSGRPWS